MIKINEMIVFQIRINKELHIPNHDNISLNNKRGDVDNWKQFHI